VRVCCLNVCRCCYDAVVAADQPVSEQGKEAVGGYAIHIDLAVDFRQVLKDFHFGQADKDAPLVIPSNLLAGSAPERVQPSIHNLAAV
jgi:hypothetical protein